MGEFSAPAQPDLTKYFASSHSLPYLHPDAVLFHMAILRCPTVFMGNHNAVSAVLTLNIGSIF